MDTSKSAVQEVGGVALDAGDRARLQRIESGLKRDDPGLAQQFRSWRPSSGGGPLLPGWSAAPEWMLIVFVVASCTWAVSPVLGVLVAVVAGVGRLLARAGRRAGTPKPPARGGRVFGWPDARG